MRRWFTLHQPLRLRSGAGQLYILIAVAGRKGGNGRVLCSSNALQLHTDDCSLTWGIYNYGSFLWNSRLFFLSTWNDLCWRIICYALKFYSNFKLCIRPFTVWLPSESKYNIFLFLYFQTVIIKWPAITTYSSHFLRKYHIKLVS